MLVIQSSSKLFQGSSWSSQHFAQDGKIQGIAEEISAAGEIGFQLPQVHLCVGLKDDSGTCCMV